MIKHIFSDMDGTLLNSQGVISKTNTDIIKASKIPLTLVSARAPMEMAAVIDCLQLSTPQIGFNGGLIFQRQATSWHVLQESTIELATAAHIYQLVQQKFPNVSRSFYDRDRWYAPRIDAGIQYEHQLTDQIPTMTASTEFFADATHQVFKLMLITFDPEEMTALQSCLTDLNLAGISIQQAGAAYLEITSDQAKKSRGIDYILAHDHLVKADTAAFGDGYNDLPMLKRVGYPIVMANAQPDIQQAGRVITKTNDEDGVGYGIQHWLSQGGQ
ncbi:HAD family hydrolase [Loigolactobacillus jiayinensis]|uniref:HAD family hydrolase n=1 Tax=Loigolactobacillus jiayinensis TaxID=2486016 RepID=A0ABW1RBX0_9LACO|nr:HAD family hydrolase [Loigolactobacillus jiayinensis]